MGTSVSAPGERDVLRRIIAAQELERQRLADELHDKTGQALASILLGLRSLEEVKTTERDRTLEELRELVGATLQSVRRLAVTLHPKALEDFGLIPALEHLVEGFREQTGARVELEASLCEKRLPAEIETALFRLTQEALSNVVKHAQARCVSIVLRRTEGSVTLLIEDDGTGFAAGCGDGGLGLTAMRERLALLNGRLTVESNVRSGTALVAEIPL